MEEQEITTPEDHASQQESFSFKESKALEQDINFYLLLPKKTSSFLTKKVVLTSYGAFLLFLMVLFIVVFLQEKKLKVQSNQLEKIVAAQAIELQKFTSSYPISNMDDLKKAMQDTQADYENNVNAVDLLSLNMNFSKYLIALSGAAIEGVWLKEIDFNRTGNKIILKGISLQHPLLEQYLTQLGMQKAFSEFSFELQELTVTTTPASFLITTKSE